VSVAEVSDVLSVFKTIVSELGAGSLEGSDSLSKTGKVFRKENRTCLKVSMRVAENGVDVVESVIEELDGLNFLHVGIEVFRSGVSFVSSLQMNELCVSCVFLARRTRRHTSSEGAGSSLVTQIISESLVQPGKVTILLRMRLVNKREELSELLGKGFVVDVVRISVFHPNNGESVTKTGVKFLTIDNIIRRTVASP
jgi:hypothetical protein